MLDAIRAEKRKDFLVEEVDEYTDALEEDDFIEQVDGLVDIIYIAIGTLLEMGIPIRSVFEEIHDSNMRKLDANGKPIIEGGKIRKPEGWVGPNVAGAIHASDFSEWALSQQALIDELNDLSEERGKEYDKGYDDGYDSGRDAGYASAEADYGVHS